MSVGNYIVFLCIMMTCSVITLSQSFGETFSFQLQIIKWSQSVASKCVSDYTTLYLKDQYTYMLFLSNIDVMVDLSFCYSWRHVNSGCTALLSHNLCSNRKWVNSADRCTVSFTTVTRYILNIRLGGFFKILPFRNLGFIYSFNSYLCTYIKCLGQICTEFFLLPFLTANWATAPNRFYYPLHNSVGVVVHESRRMQSFLAWALLVCSTEGVRLA
jgi:hypothetical protein